MGSSPVIEQNDETVAVQDRRVQVRVQGRHIPRSDRPPARRADGLPVEGVALSLEPEAALECDSRRAAVADPDFQVLIRQPAPAALAGENLRHGRIGYDGHFEHIENLLATDEH